MMSAATGGRELRQRASVLALPSHAEGLPYALPARTAAGVVPVATAVGAIRDAVRNRVHGMLGSPRGSIEVADALQALHEDLRALRRMGLAARQRILERYSMARFRSAFHRLPASLACDVSAPDGAG